MVHASMLCTTFNGSLIYSNFTKQLAIFDIFKSQNIAFFQSSYIISDIALVNFKKNNSIYCGDTKGYISHFNYNNNSKEIEFLWRKCVHNDEIFNILYLSYSGQKKHHLLISISELKIVI